MCSGAVTVKPIEESDRRWLLATLEEWGDRRIVSGGRLTEDASVLPGFVAERNGAPVGYVLLRRIDDELEVVAIRSLEPGQGIGTALLGAAEAEARRAGCRRRRTTTSTRSASTSAGAGSGSPSTATRLPQAAR